MVGLLFIWLILSMAFQAICLLAPQLWNTYTDEAGSFNPSLPHFHWVSLCLMFLALAALQCCLCRFVLLPNRIMFVLGWIEVSIMAELVTAMRANSGKSLSVISEQLIRMMVKFKKNIVTNITTEICPY